MGDIIIRVIMFPTFKAKGTVKEDSDGNYNVYINSALCREQQIKAVEHEIKHIRNQHLNRDISIETAEMEADI